MARKLSPENTSEHAPTRVERGKFAPGVSGNPGGRPKVVGDVRDLARKHTADAMATLVRIAGDEAAPPAAQVAAAEAILNRAWGRPTQAVDVTATVTALTPEQRAERVRDLLAAAAARTGQEDEEE